MAYMSYRRLQFVLCVSAVWATACVDVSLPPQLQRKVVPGLPDAWVSEPAPDAAAEPDANADVNVGSDPTAVVPPDAAPPPAPLPLGRRCASGADCASGSCTDGVCCGSACTALCYACNQPGLEGTCLPIAAGQDPGGECAQDPPATCGHDGTCDGSGGCRRYGAGVLCEPGKCAGALESAARTCDGNGVCQPGSSRSCAPNACAGSSCRTVCAADADCQTGFLCEGGTCKSKRPMGAACTGASQCATGYCADGICCGTPCTERCYSCNQAVAPGVCTPVAEGADPGNDCSAEAGATCGRAGGCDGKGSCRLHPAGTPCGAAGCSGGAAIGARTCNGSGQCGAGTRQECGNFACLNASCASTCTADAQCKPGLTCVGGDCQAPTVIAPPPALALRWNFDEDSGTGALDSSGNVLHGTYVGDSGAPTPSTAVPPVTFADPRSRAFVRSSRHAVLLGTMPPALKPANNFTVSLWFQASSVDSGGAELFSAGNQYLVRLGDTSLRFSKRPAGGNGSVQCEVTGLACLDGQWHHVTAVQSPSGMKLYLDGVERCTNTHGEDVRYDGGPSLFVGRHPDSSSYDFEGNLDDVRIYSGALSAAEVQALAKGN